jgi:hypothetical protein
MRLKLLVCSRDAVVDRLTNLASLFGIWEEFTPTAFPVIIPNFCIFALFEKTGREADHQEVDLKITLAKKEFFSQSIPVDFQGKQRVRNITQMNGMPLTGPGILSVSISKGTTVLGAYDMMVAEGEVSIKTPQAVAAANAVPPPASSDSKQIASKSRRRRRRLRR